MQKPVKKNKPKATIKYYKHRYINDSVSISHLTDYQNDIIKECKVAIPHVTDEFVKDAICINVASISVGFDFPNHNFEAELKEYNQYLKDLKEYEESIAAKKASFDELNKEFQEKKRQKLLKSVASIANRAAESADFDIERALSDCISKLEKEEAKFRSRNYLV